MTRRVKDFIEIKSIVSLDALIEQLVAARDSLPACAQAEVRMRGDDIFGRQLAISYFRDQTPEEAECDARCDAACLAGQAYLAADTPPRGTLRIVA